MAPRKILWAVNLGLAGLLVYLAFGAVVQNPADADARRTPPPRDEVVPSEPDRRAVGRQECIPVLNRNVFGVTVRTVPPKKSPRPEPRPAPQESLPPLQVKLLGTIAGDDAVCRALLEDVRSHSADIFCVGDHVQGARVESIGDRRVVLVRNGRREIVHLAISPGGKGRPSRSRASRTTGSRSARSAASFGAAEGGRRIIVDRRNIYGRIDSIEKILKTAELDPCNFHGRTIGLKISGITDAKLKTLTNLRNDDIIMAINGRTLTSRDQACRALRRARGSPAVNLKLKRGAKEEFISFRISG